MQAVLRLYKDVDGYNETQHPLLFVAVGVLFYLSIPHRLAFSINARSFITAS